MHIVFENQKPLYISDEYRPSQDFEGDRQSPRRLCIVIKNMKLKIVYVYIDLAL